MKVPLYLKTNRESDAVCLGVIDLYPHEFNSQHITRVLNTGPTTTDYANAATAAVLPIPVVCVTAEIYAGPYSVPYAVHTVEPKHYVTAEVFWRNFLVTR